MRREEKRQQSGTSAFSLKEVAVFWFKDVKVWLFLKCHGLFLSNIREMIPKRLVDWERDILKWFPTSLKITQLFRGIASSLQNQAQVPVLFPLSVLFTLLHLRTQVSVALSNHMHNASDCRKEEKPNIKDLSPVLFPTYSNCGPQKRGSSLGWYWLWRMTFRTVNPTLIFSMLHFQFFLNHLMVGSTKQMILHWLGCFREEAEGIQCYSPNCSPRKPPTGMVREQKHAFLVASFRHNSEECPSSDTSGKEPRDEC